MTTVPVLATNMTDEQRAIYYAQMSSVQKDEVVGVLLALFLGTFGIHHFYLRRTGLGILYCCFFWTGIPTLVSFIECFFMPGRVREYNMQQAAYISAYIRGAYPGFSQPPAGGMAVSPSVTPATACPKCGAPTLQGVRFCASCGSAVGF
jgi:TM2 domain-containing membrane protein YozV